MKLYFSNFVSRLFGLFAQKKFPTIIQQNINLIYAWFFNINTSEFSTPKAYKTLNAFFTRSLSRPRELDNAPFIYPCDSKIVACGKIKDGEALQIKGMSYGISELFGENLPYSAKKELNGGYFLNLYLSPSDYHRYHAPSSMQILEAHYISGKLLPVNLKWLNKKLDLYCENERVVLVCKSGESLFYMVFVGALNVGKMVFNFDDSIQTNSKNCNRYYKKYSNIFVHQGEELGRFEMGSTILLFFKDECFDCEIGRKVRFGDMIGEIHV